MAERLRALLEGWLEYVETHSYAWHMLFRDTGGGPDVAGIPARGAHPRPRGARRHHPVAGRRADPTAEIEPLAELMSMGMAALVLWWMDNPGTSRAALVDAMTRVWAGLLSPDG